LIVVDASVAVKWLLPEEDEDSAQQVLDSGESLIGPELIRVEVAAAVARKVRFQEITAHDGETAAALWIQSIADGVITLISNETDVRDAFRLALALKHPLQDCLYLALAQRLGVPLVTANRKFAARARSSYAFVQMLG